MLLENVTVDTRRLFGDASHIEYGARCAGEPREVAPNVERHDAVALKGAAMEDVESGGCKVQAAGIDWVVKRKPIVVPDLRRQRAQMLTTSLCIVELVAVHMQATRDSIAPVFDVVPSRGEMPMAADSNYEGRVACPDRPAIRPLSVKHHAD